MIKLTAAIVAFAAATGIGALVLASGQPPSGPIEPVWNHDVCAECRMQIGDPSFAAQVHRHDGDVLHFDDPGCAFRFLAGVAQRDVHAVYFHHVRQNRWLAERTVGFVRSPRSPMGYGLGAVDSSEPGAMSRVVAQRRAEARR